MENQKGEWTIFKLSDLEGALVLGGPNRAVAAEVNWRGLLFGNNYPVVNHFQIGNVCSSASRFGRLKLKSLFGCSSAEWNQRSGVIALNQLPGLSPFGPGDRVSHLCPIFATFLPPPTATCTAPDQNTGYSTGILLVADWYNGEDERRSSKTAHFGGTSQIEQGWAVRGRRLLAR